MTEIPNGKNLGERIGGPPADEADHFMKCPDCGDWVDCRDIGAVFDHAKPLPHPKRENVSSRQSTTVFDRAEAVRCPDCALAGIASFANEQASAKFRLPEGFKLVATDAGNQIYCIACNRQAITLPIDP